MKNKRKVMRIIWWIYIVLLFLVVVIKFRGSFSELWERINSFVKVFAVGFLSVMFIEVFQFITKLGSFDVDDIILNSVGIIVGYVLIC